MSNGIRTETGVVRAYPAAGDWTRRAACRVVDTEVFYDGRSNFIATARGICADCPVQFECLDYALACESLDPYGGHGVWAGLTGRERNAIRRTQPDNGTTQPNHLESA